MAKQKNEVNKPLTLIVDDFENDMVKFINDSGLPFFMVETVLTKILDGVKAAAAQQLNADRAKYNEAMEQTKNESK